MNENTSKTPEQREMAIYEAAVEKWGRRAQIQKAVEEMAELTQALMKLYFLEEFGTGDRNDIIENIDMERADVQILLNQLHIIFGDNSAAECERLNHLAGMLGLEGLE